MRCRPERFFFAPRSVEGALARALVKKSCTMQTPGEPDPHQILALNGAEATLRDHVREASFVEVEIQRTGGPQDESLDVHVQQDVIWWFRSAPSGIGADVANDVDPLADLRLV